MIDSILEALEEGVKALKSNEDKAYCTKVNDTMQLLLQALNRLYYG